MYQYSVLIEPPVSVLVPLCVQYIKTQLLCVALKAPLEQSLLLNSSWKSVSIHSCVIQCLFHVKQKKTSDNSYGWQLRTRLTFLWGAWVCSPRCLSELSYDTTLPWQWEGVLEGKEKDAYESQWRIPNILCMWHMRYKNSC